MLCAVLPFINFQFTVLKDIADNIRTFSEHIKLKNSSKNVTNDYKIHMLAN